MKIIFDLDYTLLDTEKFKKKMADIFSQEDFKADYEKYFKKQGINFDFDEYLAILNDEGRIDNKREKKLRLEIEELISHIDNYLRPDAENVLKYFKDSGAELILITFGNKKWQERKVKNLTIAKYFDNIIYEEQEKYKSEYLKSLSDGKEEILIINDNLSEANEILKILKRGELHLVDGPYNGGKEVRVKTLTELMSKKSENKELNLK
ncbi:MAG: NIF family HAD-type phosphatase [Candidatus Falkowbacteria bacterium]